MEQILPFLLVGAFVSTSIGAVIFIGIWLVTKIVKIIKG